MPFRIVILALYLMVTFFAMPSLAEESLVRGIAKPWQWYFQEGATPVKEQLNDLHNFIFYIILVVSIFVTGLLAYVCVRFRRSRNPIPSKTTHNTAIEIIWTTIPVLILVAIFIPSLKLHYYMDRAQDPDITLKVTGYQWYWGYTYSDLGLDEYLSNIKQKKDLKKGEPRLLAVDNPLVVPVDTTVRVLVSAADVIHSFAMPAFGVKTDAVPGRLNETWFRAEKTGIYYGQCSELCGVNHGFMPIEIRVVEKDVFTQWVERAKEGKFDLDGISIPEGNIVASSSSSTDTSSGEVDTTEQAPKKQ
jgi:cytochrome c oxidase subunit II